MMELLHQNYPVIADFKLDYQMDYKTNYTTCTL